MDSLDLILWSQKRQRQAAAKGKGGSSWSSYWATLISATVETAAPTHVVLTFPSAKTSLTDTDFTIAGFTIASASWTGAVLTLVLSEAVLVFDGDLTITFVTTSGTATVTNNVADDGHTVAWYDYSATDTLTDDGGGLISKWEDRLGSGHDLLSSGDARPTLNTTGVVCAAKSMQTEAFTYEQPEKIYCVFRQNSWQSGYGILDGITLQSGILFQRISTPNYAIYAGTSSVQDTSPLAVGDYGIVRLLFSGATSSIRTNTASAVTGNAGAGNMGGITIGARGNLSDPANVTFLEIIARDNVDDAATDTAIFTYLTRKHGFFLT